MTRLSILPLLVVVAAAAAPAAAETPSTHAIKKAARLHQKGERALRVGNVDRAQGLFEQSLEVVPSFPEAHLGLGTVRMIEKRFEEALRHYRAARDGFGELRDALLSVRQQRYAEARDEIRALHDAIYRLESLSGRNAPLDANLRISRMRNTIRQLEGIEPPDAGSNEPPGEIHFHIGNALFQLGRTGEALEAYEACRERSPRFATLYNNLALVYWKLGRIDDALDSLDTAAELGFPVNPRFRGDIEASR